MNSRTLILIDMDSPAAQPLLSRSAAPGFSLDSNNPETVVVVAGNTKSFLSRAGRRAVLESMALALAGDPLLVDSPKDRSVGLEVCMVPVVPQAADRALLRLLREAAVEGHGGDFRSIVLIANDVALMIDVTECLSGRVGKRRELTHEVGCRWSLDPNATMTGWTREFSRTQVSVVRPFRRKSPPGAGALATTGGGWVAFVEDAASAAGMTRRRLDVSLSTALPEVKDVAVLSSEVPALLSQVGPTVGSLRGVERLSRNQDSVGLCGEQDRLELLSIPSNAATRNQIDIEGPAIRGPLVEGAVRLPDLGFSLATKLPFEVVEAAWNHAHAMGQDFPVDLNPPHPPGSLTGLSMKLRDDEVVRALPQDWTGSKVYLADLWNRAGRIRQVRLGNSTQPEDGQHLSCWRKQTEKAPEAEWTLGPVRLEFQGTEPLRRLPVRLCRRVDRIEAIPSVFSGLKDKAELEVHEPILRSHVGLALSDHGERVALFAAKGRIPAGRVQAVSAHGGSVGYGSRSILRKVGRAPVAVAIPSGRTSP